MTFHRQHRSTQPAQLPADLPRPGGALRASGQVEREVKDELPTNLLAVLRSGRDPWPGVVGFEDTVLPQLERALLAGHDVVLLGSAVKADPTTPRARRTARCVDPGHRMR